MKIFVLRCSCYVAEKGVCTELYICRKKEVSRGWKMANEYTHESTESTTKGDRCTSRRNGQIPLFDLNI